MKRIAALILFVGLWASPVLAQQPTLPTYWYWQVAGTNPSTQVWEATSGSFVSNTSSNFTTWLALVSVNPPVGALGLSQAICNATNNGSGAVRITLCPGQPGTGGWATGNFKTVTGVGGATGANGARTITVIDQFNVDLQGTTFGGTYTSGGVIGTGSTMDTATGMNTTINRYNQSLVAPGVYSGIGNFITSTAVLTNPLKSYQSVNMGAPGQTVTLPQSNLFGSIPIGLTITFQGQGANTWNLNKASGSTLLTVPLGFSVLLTLNANDSTDGSWTYVLAPTSAGVTCGAGLGGTTRTVSGLVTTC